jgi:isopenicillin N synthase-like dioxygenase
MKQSGLPIIDVTALVKNAGNTRDIAEAIRIACVERGFFYITGHGIDDVLQKRLEILSSHFFNLDLEEKMAIRMELGGRAWRGYFSVGDELTSGKPDLKEGLYFGAELPDDDSRVVAGLSLHGSNLFPKELPELRNVVLDYIEKVTTLGHSLMRGISLSLGLPETYFNDHFTADPLTLFRIFHYPAMKEVNTEQWGVGEHTDYGVLTILKQDAVGGLQVKSKSGWIDAPYIPGTYVCNIGDMLDRLTRGYYRSTPHRVLNTSGRGRFSFPFFFDPNFDARLNPIELGDIPKAVDDKERRWDKSSVHEFEGTYGEYLLGKVSRVFPELGESELG